MGTKESEELRAQFKAKLIAIDARIEVLPEEGTSEYLDDIEDDLAELRREMDACEKKHTFFRSAKFKRFREAIFQLLAVLFFSFIGYFALSLLIPTIFDLPSFIRQKKTLFNWMKEISFLVIWLLFLLSNLVIPVVGLIGLPKALYETFFVKKDEDFE